MLHVLLDEPDLRDCRCELESDDRIKLGDVRDTREASTVISSE